MGSDSHASSSSRKRPLPDDNTGPSAKRAAPDVPDFVAKNPQLREQYRKQVKAYFEWYEALSRTQDNSNQLVPFQGLLDGARGNAAEKRLAARMIPRFIHKFPHQVDAAATALLELYNSSSGSGAEAEPEALACKTRLDALRGLADVCSAAAQLGDKATRPVVRLVEFLLRHIQQLTSAAPEPGEAHPAINVETGKLDGLDISRQVLERAFRCFPRPVLTCCWDACCGTDADLLRGATRFLREQLLPARQALEDEQCRPASLAASVLGASSAGRAWLLDCLAQPEQEVSNKEAHQLLERIAKQLPQHMLAPPAPAAQEAAAAPAQPSPTPAAPTAGLPRAPGGQLPPPAPTPLPKAVPRAQRDGARTPATQLPGAAGTHHTGPRQAASLQQPPAAPPEALPGAPAADDDVARDARQLFPPPGGPICRAEACLWFGNLPPTCTKSGLAAELRRAGGAAPAELYLLDVPGRDQAVCVFPSCKDAAQCYQQVAGATLQGRQLSVHFCSTLPAHSPAKALGRPSQFVWLAGSAPGWVERVVRALDASRLARPAHVVPVEGRQPGYILDMRDGAAAQAAERLLQARFGTAQQAGGAAAAAGAGGKALPPAPSLPAHMQQQQQQGGSSGGRSPASAGPSGARGGCALLISGLAADAQEQQLLAACRRFGPLAGFSLQRHAGSASVEYVTTAAAAEARSRLHGARFGSSCVQVDYDPGRRAREQQPAAGANGSQQNGRPHELTPGRPYQQQHGTPYQHPTPQGSGMRPGQRDQRSRVLQTPGTEVGLALPPPPIPTSGTPAAYQTPHVPPPASASRFRESAIRSVQHGYQQRLQQQEQVPGSRAAGPGQQQQQQLWRGHLLRSGQLQCTAMCLPCAQAAPPPGSLAAEPHAWPPELNMTSRSPYELLQQLYQQLPQVQRYVRVLRCGDDGHAGAFASFADYLVQRRRAGVVALPDSSAGRRTLYLAPAVPEVLDMLQLRPSGGGTQDVLYAVVITTGQ